MRPLIVDRDGCIICQLDLSEAAVRQLGDLDPGGDDPVLLIVVAQLVQLQFHQVVFRLDHRVGHRPCLPSRQIIYRTDCDRRHRYFDTECRVVAGCADGDHRARNPLVTLVPRGS